ncbi:uncharacterized protein LOC118510735 [Anopheles stephensi]|uniref:uncharacterized protein LOC118510735 n=1 Tax=Anopheles stephensi TaxID=30069 RepID=UPI00165875A7|nr:uncharacterized protein LOC118510735 [Anopheles stephensi]
MGRGKLSAKQRNIKIPLATFNGLEKLNSEQVQLVSPNAYAALDNDVEEHPMDTNTTKPNSTKRNVRVPPIKIACKSLGEVHKKITAAGVVRYTTKVVNEGIVVYTNTSEDFRAVVRHLSNNKTNFHMQTEEVTRVLEEEGIKPVSVKKLNVRNKKYDEHATYLLHFSKGSVDLAKLRCINALEHCRVRWNYYSNRQGPMQCKRCQSYGHGAANCHHPAICNKCAGQHESKICPLAATTSCENGVIPAHKLKCANCDGNHPANFWNCPKKPAKPKASAPKKPVSRDFVFEGNAFPALPPVQTSYSAINQNASHHHTYNDELFNTTEITSIVGEVFCKLRSCKSKEQQITAIFEVVSKFCFNM